MKTIKMSLLAILLVLCSSQLFAHALWIETNATGKAGQAQQVKLFYGEYAQNERDSVAKWYSDVKELTLWLVGPDQQKIKLNTTLGYNVATASFTPAKDGIYTLLVSHPAKELAGTTAYHFLATATVQVGNAKGFDEKAFSTELKVIPLGAGSFTVNTTVKLKAAVKGVIAKAKTISVFSPSGWTKEIVTNASGVAEFTPIWPGRYVVEVSDYQKGKGEQLGKAYEASWKGATYSFEVK
ncbi:DUF4198 domain-containing protein [Pedobacter sp. MC2016-14]|uniref:DUF4198 domain-containing protein n=1 Tax=Pedobacter sp. MC2016-14 TaxID=2897327 RepID=UPI001E4BC443|nr:DUF4198 domain-containing protein [Pedobacter sp. MC2016-14]MCD0488600.1 DUF4198 domain-containing protein [Pedobacter sp. MC2016-14]